jgi:hypothetical protein
MSGQHDAIASLPPDRRSFVLDDTRARCQTAQDGPSAKEAAPPVA